LYANDSGNVIIISVDKGSGDSPATFLNLRPGLKPLRRTMALSSTGMLTGGGHDIAHFVDAARHLIVLLDRDFPLVARWECLSQTDGVDLRFSAVPIPVDPKHLLYERLRALQAQHMPVPVASPDDQRSIPSDAAPPEASMHFSADFVTEVISWSPSVVSLLDWISSYGGGAHHNLGFERATRGSNPLTGSGAMPN
jgi:hypothetical protein